jgi:integrase
MGWRDPYAALAHTEICSTMVDLKINCTLHGFLMRRLGHANAAVTLKVYRHLYRNTDTRAAEIMEATFAKVRTE